MTVLKTERLVLRAVVETDLDNIYKYAKNPNVGPRAGWPPHKDKSVSEEIMNTLFIGRDTVWAITLKDDDSFRGVVGLEDDPKRNNKHARMLGYWLNEDDWGKGYITEASREVLRYGFKDMNAPIITSNCYDFNEGSRNVIEKIGMKFEGILRQGEERFDGKVFDLCMYSYLKEEYLAE
jgi:putative acetyltransferase